jgi:hypothetical protein
VVAQGTGDMFDSPRQRLLECTVAAGKCGTRRLSNGAERVVCAAGADSFFLFRAVATVAAVFAAQVSSSYFLLKEVVS